MSKGYVRADEESQQRHDVETLPRDELKQLQGERLRETVERVYENVELYREKLDEAGVSPADIETIDDVTKLPFTTKEDFRDEYPDGLFAVRDEDIVRIHASSGTTGKPKIVGYTEQDRQNWRRVMARSLSAAGIESGDTFQNAYGYGLFTGGLGFHGGVEQLNATVVPIGGGNTGRQLEMMQDLECDALGCTPSYCLYLAEEAESRGIDPRDLPLSTVVIGAEPFTDPMRQAIEEALDVTAVDIYGLSELIGPGVAIECRDQQEGLHVWEDHFYPEIIDPETGEPVEPGERGELVLTSLTKEALPVLRYRTGDVTRLLEAPCDCGRTAVRMENISGRVDDLLIVRGVNVYASAIEEVMLDFDEVAPHYRIDLYREDNLDRMEITVEHQREFAGETDELGERIEAALNKTLDITLDNLDVASPGDIERQETGKVQRVYDHR
jgi:phenylacetate-CoA ligase